MMFSFARWGNELYTGERSYDIVGKRRRWFAIAIAGVVLSILVLGIKGMNLGIEFRGGTEFTVSNATTTSSAPATEVLAAEGVSDIRTAVVGGSAVRIQTEALDTELVEQLRGDLAEAYGVDVSEITSTFVGPAWGADVTTKALQGLLTFLALVTVVMSIYFRSWRMSVAAVVALLHDLVITVGAYALIGFEVTPASVIGFLTILGYSLYDTVVVFDKVRENTAGAIQQKDHTYAEAANLAVNQTLVRSINTSVVGLLPVAAILFVGAFLLGAGTLKDIALALFIGMLISTISSIFLATPLEVELREREASVAEHTAEILARRAAGAPAISVTTDRKGRTVRTGR
nr:protein translocase subunit SecF [Actinomycetales bacterium]